MKKIFNKTTAFITLKQAPAVIGGIWILLQTFDYITQPRQKLHARATTSAYELPWNVNDLVRPTDLECAFDTLLSMQNNKVNEAVEKGVIKSYGAKHVQLYLEYLSHPQRKLVFTDSLFQLLHYQTIRELLHYSHYTRVLIENTGKKEIKHPSLLVSASGIYSIQYNGTRSPVKQFTGSIPLQNILPTSAAEVFMWTTDKTGLNEIRLVHDGGVVKVKTLGKKNSYE